MNSILTILRKHIDNKIADPYQAAADELNMNRQQVKQLAYVYSYGANPDLIKQILQERLK